MSYPKLTPIIAKGATEPRYLEDRFADVINVKDFGVIGDGETDDTSVFEALESTAEKGKEIDLFGKTYKVDSLPTKCKYCNGWFNIDGFLYPTEDIYSNVITRVSPNNGNYNAWPQDTAHTWNNVLYTFFIEDEAHNTGASHPVLAFSTDGGNSFPYNQHIAVDDTSANGAVVFSAGITTRGTQLAVLHKNHNGSSYDNNKTLMLIGRKAFEALPISSEEYEYDVTITSTSGSSSYTFYMENGHGLVVGDTVSINGNITIGGNNIVGKIFTVESVTSLTQCTLTCDTTAVASGTVDLINNAYVCLNEYGKFHEMLFDGSKHLGEKLKEITGASDDPTLAHSLCIVNDDAYFCIHGRGYSKLYIVKISNLSLSTRSLSVTEVSSTGVEGTLANLGNGYLIGAIRRQSTSYPLRFFTYRISNGDIQIYNSRFSENHFLGSPAPVRIVGEGENKEVVFCMGEDRTEQLQKVNIVIAHAKLEDITANISNFESKLRYEVVATAYHTSSETTSAGVPSLTSLGSSLYLFYSSDHPMTVSSNEGEPHVYCCRLNFSRWVSGNNGNIPTVFATNDATTGLRDNSFSCPEWQDIKIHTKINGNGSETNEKLRRNLKTTFDTKTPPETGFNTAKVHFDFYIREIRSSGLERNFSIGHNKYTISVLPYGLFKSLDGSKTSVGMYVLDTPTENGFYLRGRMPTISNSNISYQDGLADASIDVILEKPVDWLD